MRKILLAFLILFSLTGGCLEERVGTIIYEEVVIPEPIIPGADPLVAGKRVYETFCQGCHALNGKGTGMPNQPDFSAASFFESKSQEDLIASITTGIEGTAMPLWGDKLSPEEIEAVYLYEESFSG